MILLFSFILRRPSLQVMDDEYLTLLATLDHPHLLTEQVYRRMARKQTCKRLPEDDHPWVSMHEKLRDRGAFHEFQIKPSVLAALSALVYLHNQGILHRQLQPSALVFDANGIFKLAELELMMKYEKVEATTGFCVGHPYYMAPEVIEMQCPTPASDIWSLACTILALVTGAPPHSDCSPMRALFRIVQDGVSVPSWLSAELADLLSSCLQVSPETRPSAVQLMRHAWFQIPSLAQMCLNRITEEPSILPCDSLFKTDLYCTCLMQKIYFNESAYFLKINEERFTLY